LIAAGNRKYQMHSLKWQLKITFKFAAVFIYFSIDSEVVGYLVHALVANNHS
jgi:hypothetical protein